MKIQQILENTTAGSVATVAQPMMTQSRENTNVRGLKPVQQLMKGKASKKGPYANSIVESNVTEDDLAEQDLIVVPGQGRLKRTGFVKHDLDQGEHEGHTLKNSLHTIARAAMDLDKRLSVQSEFPEWVSEKIGAAKGMMVSVMDYLISSQEMQQDTDAMSEGEKNTSYMNKQNQDFYNKNPNFKRDDRGVKFVGNQLASIVTPTNKPGQVAKKPMTPFKTQGVAEASNTMQRYGQKIIKQAKAARAAEQAARAAELEPKKEEPQAPSDNSSISTRDLMQQLRKPKKQGVAEETIHVGHRNSKGDWIKTSTHSNYRDADKAMKDLKAQGKKGVQHRYDNKGSIDPGAMMTHRSDRGVAEGRMVRGPGGMPLDRQGNPKVAKPAMPAAPKLSSPKLTISDVWRKVEEVVSQIYPDGDPIDWLLPWFRKQGIADHKVGDILAKAARKNGYKDIYDYYNSMGDDLGEGVAEGQLDEMNRDTVTSYVGKAEKDQDKQFTTIGKGIRDKDPKSANKAGHKFSMRSVGLGRAEKRLQNKTVEEGAMPASVIRVKEKIRLMTDAEKKEYFKGKTQAQLQQMARRHGYGENSNVYAKYATQGVTEVSDATKASYKEKATQQVKDLTPDAKKGEYKDIAQNMISRRQKGIDRVTARGVAEGKIDQAWNAAKKTVSEGFK